jgi:tRNA nucleotidyltransferase/poly(A) polymerase
MAIDLDTNELIDPFNGLTDLKNKVIRHTSKFFIEDPLRVLRVARFHANYKFTISSSTFELMKSIPLEDFAKINKERIYKELTKLEGIKDVEPFFKILEDINLLNLYFPEIKLSELDFNLHSNIVKNYSKDIDSFVPALLHKGNLNQMDLRNFITKKQIKRAKLINIVYNKELSIYDKVHLIVKERLLTESLDTIKFVEFCGKLDLTKEIIAVKSTIFNQDEMKLVSDKLEYRIQSILKNMK